MISNIEDDMRSYFVSGSVSWTLAKHVAPRRPSLGCKTECISPKSLSPCVSSTRKSRVSLSSPALAPRAIPPQQRLSSRS